MGVTIYVPDMSHFLFLEVIVHPLTDADQTILVATGEHQEFQLGFRRCRVRTQLCRWFGVRRGGESTQPRKVSRWVRPKFNV